MIYLDYTANAPVEPRALEVFCKAETKYIGNPNAHHPLGEVAKAAMDTAVKRMAALLNVAPETVICTSGASESNNTAIKGIAHASRHIGRHIVTTPMEHASVSGALTALQERGWEVEVLSVGEDGRIDLNELKGLIRKDTVLVTLPYVDSELGVVQPVAEAAEIVHAFPDCRLHVDATQAAGKLPMDISCADTVSLSGHKLGGLNGSGLLIRKADVPMEPLIHGGVSTTLYRSGTPAVGLAVSLAEALSIALERQEERYEKVREMNAFLRDALKMRKDVTIHSPEDALPHILNIGVKGIRGQRFRDALAERGVCVSVKSACSVENTPSRAVYAVTRSRALALESWRISLSHLTTMDELKEFLIYFDEITKELKQ